MANRRVLLIMLTMIVCVSLVVMNVLYTMVTGLHYRSGSDILSYTSSSNYVVEEIISNRGSIYDRNLEVIAQDVVAYDLYAIIDTSRTDVDDAAAYVVDYEATCEALAEILDCDSDILLGYLELAEENGYYQTEFGTYGKSLTSDQKEAIEALELPGIEFEETRTRAYPVGTFASQLIGYAAYDYDEDKLTGVLGIEAYYDDLLSGTNGELTYQTDSDGYPLSSTKKYTKTALDGYDIYLTIDKNVQLAVETALEATMEENDATMAWCVVMNAKTGEILAQAGYPTFDLNEREDINYVNIPSETAFECGSVIKPLVYAGAIEEGVYDGDATFTSGTVYVGLDSNGNLAKVSSEDADNWLITVSDALGKNYGTVTYDDGLIRSLNTAMVNLFINFYDMDTNIEYLKLLGLFEEVGIDGMSESAGTLNDSSIANKITLGFGQGSTFTTYQLIQAYSAIFGDGCTVTPYVIDKIVDPNTGEIVYEGETVKSEQIFSDETLEEIQSLLKRVVSESYGTASSYAIDGISMMAKTGTGEVVVDGSYSTTLFTCSVMAALPADDPEIIIFYGLQTENYLSFSKEYFKDIATEALLAVDSYSENNTNTTTSISSATYSVFTMPDLTNHTLDYAEEKLASLTENIVTIGDGDTIITQYPTSGTETISTQNVFLLTDGTNITMPNMIGWTRKDVQAFASLAGIDIDITGSGTVSSQSVSSGTVIDSDSEISVTLE